MFVYIIHILIIIGISLSGAQFGNILAISIKDISIFFTPTNFASGNVV